MKKGMFLGTYWPKLIDKGRLALPKKIREEIERQRIILTIGFDECVFGFKEKEWEEIIKPELLRPLFSDKEGRALRRKMCAEAVVVNLGVQGRFIIPERMLEYAGIKEKIVLIGAGDHFEIWDKASWEKYETKIKKDS